MTEKEEEQGKISKEIVESITTIPEPIKTCPSAFLLPFENSVIIPIQEESTSKKQIEEPEKEYKIGNYLVKKTLGQGTFGKVKLGIYIPNEEKVAIKILEKNRIIEKDDEIRVKREFDMLAQFNHPNVILVAEIFESADSFYSVMEFCEGGELFNYIVKNRRLSDEEASYFFFQLINGLEYIHSLGIVHRDLKPENLLLTSDHILKIIDFGLSNYFHENQEELLATPCGSPCYASPEMVAGKKYDGFKIDIWSCGIILYAMLCGYLPFEDNDNEILFKKILECKLIFPSYVKDDSKDLIKKILVTEPEKRITIPEIKKHPFFLKGKELFEQEFSICQVPKDDEDENKNDEGDNIINGSNIKEESNNIEINNNLSNDIIVSDLNNENIVNELKKNDEENLSLDKNINIDKEEEIEKEFNKSEMEKKIETSDINNDRKDDMEKISNDVEKLTDIAEKQKSEKENIEKDVNNDNNNNSGDNKNKSDVEKIAEIKIPKINEDAAQQQIENKSLEKEEETKSEKQKADIGEKIETMEKLGKLEKQESIEKIDELERKTFNEFTKKSESISSLTENELISNKQLNKENTLIRENGKKERKLKINKLSKKGSKEKQKSIRSIQQTTKSKQREKIKIKIPKKQNQNKTLNYNLKDTLTPISKKTNSNRKSSRYQRSVYSSKLNHTSIAKKAKSKNLNRKKISIYGISNFNSSLKDANKIFPNTKTLTKLTETNNVRNTDYLTSKITKSVKKTKLPKKCKNIKDIKVYLPNNDNTIVHKDDFKTKLHKFHRIKTEITRTLKKDTRNLHKQQTKKIKPTMKYIIHTNTVTSNLNTTTDNKKNQIKDKKLELKYITNLNNNDNNDLQYKKLSSTLTSINTNDNTKKIKLNYPKPQVIDTNLHRHDYTNNLVNNTISSTSKNSNNFKNGIIFGKKILNNYNKILNKNENTNYRHSYLNTNINDSNYERRSAFNFNVNKNNIKTDHVVHSIKKPSSIRTSSQLKTYSNSVRSHKLNNYFENKKCNLYTPAQFTYLNSLAKFTEFNQKRKTPHYIISKKNDEKKKFVDLKSSNAISSFKKNPFLTIRNTVINVNMINPELFMTSSFNNKRVDEKKRKINIHNKYYQNSYLNKIIPQNKNKLENSAIQKSTGLSHYDFRVQEKLREIRNKQNSFINALNENNNNRLKAICTSVRFNTNIQLNTVNQIIKKIRYPELLNKMQMHSNSLEKGHMKYNSMKLDNIKRLKNIKKTRESTNNTICDGNMRSTIGMHNYNLPSIIINKTVENENKGYLFKPQQKYFYPKIQRIKPVNKIKQFHLKGVNQKLNK